VPPWDLLLHKSIALDKLFMFIVVMILYKSHSIEFYVHYKYFSIVCIKL
jgi:hypothetical protein